MDRSWLILLNVAPISLISHRKLIVGSLITIRYAGWRDQERTSLEGNMVQCRPGWEVMLNLSRE